MLQFEKTWLVAGAVNGLIGVAAGAFAAHALKDLPERYLNAFRTGAQYELVHAVVLLIVALLPQTLPTRIAGWCFLAGIVLFSGSLYALALTRINWFGAITPFGGVSMLVGWGALIVAATTSLRKG